MIRHPVVAGQFYEGNRERLIREIERCFTCRLGPGMPGERKFSPLRGVIVPHAGYSYSGPCAAHSYKAIAESVTFDLFLILGANHTGLGSHGIATCLADWQTPLGTAVCDKEFAGQLIERTTIIDDALPHLHEHSIEVQLPFLQYLFGSVRFVPIAVSHTADFEQLGSDIRDLIRESKKKVCIIASSDFTHYGPNYDYIPFHKDIRGNIEKLDMGAVEHLKVMDSKGFQDYLDRTEATVCGRHPISLLIETLKKDVRHGKMLKYYTSGDILKDYQNSVSYVSMSF
jgi:MEMO1 family protein